MGCGWWRGGRSPAPMAPQRLSRGGGSGSPPLVVFFRRGWVVAGWAVFCRGLNGAAAPWRSGLSRWPSLSPPALSVVVGAVVLSAVQCVVCSLSCWGDVTVGAVPRPENRAGTWKKGEAKKSKHH